MTLAFCLWLMRMWWHKLHAERYLYTLDMGPLLYNTAIALIMLAQLVCWLVYMVLQTRLTSPQLAYDIYDNRETSRARLLLPDKIDNASLTVVDDGGDQAFLGYYRYCLCMSLLWPASAGSLHSFKGEEEKEKNDAVKQ
ncbi:MAG: hypothetical protein HETSPECPRED_006351 [Heterodermia speciosa]|uniref:TLC domain-containing protein n=1 Tax=Heterodermia speciosa TaxID=116794 RepID=A0A8H3FMH5_9LECA|nr:MAG: hypothetical protein HETSPECPRED_006351 [Heterodermia speciosa]